MTVTRTEELRLLRSERGEVEDLVHETWAVGGVRALVAWALLSAWLLGTRARIWLLERRRS